MIQAQKKATYHWEDRRKNFDILRDLCGVVLPVQKERRHWDHGHKVELRILTFGEKNSQHFMHMLQPIRLHETTTPTPFATTHIIHAHEQTTEYKKGRISYSLSQAVMRSSSKNQPIFNCFLRIAGNPPIGIEGFWVGVHFGIVKSWVKSWHNHGAYDTN